MKRVLFAVICLSMILSAATKDGVWQVPKAAYPPTIDGEMDDIWKAASTELIVKLNQDDAAPPDDYLDLFATGRVMWDDTNLYIFVKVVDDEISSSSANSYENDSVEYFFDGDNSKVVEAFDGVDDVQTRIEYQDGSDVSLYDTWPVPEEVEGAVADWENLDGDAFGYAVEVAVSLSSLSIEPGQIFGFELQVNDRDNEARENMYRWWGISNDAWHWAHIWGEAELINWMADDIMPVAQLPSAPVIDGVEDDVWKDIMEIHQGTYVFMNGDVVDGSFTEITDWMDAQLDFRLGWMADGFYVFAKVTDDEISTSGANAYENDSIELCFDGDNSKGDVYDGVDDVQYRWVYDEMAEGNQGITSTVAWGELDELDGYTMELMIPADQLTFTPEAGAEIGWEIQVNERDNEMRENMIRWWGNDNMTWQNPWRFGTIVLDGQVDVAKPNQVADFALNQNYPNPFNPTTTISYNVAQRSAVKLTVYDVLGNVVEELVNEVQAGPQHVAFDGSNLSSGVYFYKLETANDIITKKMMLMK